MNAEAKEEGEVLSVMIAGLGKEDDFADNIEIYRENLGHCPCSASIVG
jgi:hypothetical protein